MKVAVVGLGFFGQFHLDAWRASSAQLLAVADRDPTLGAGLEVPCYDNMAALLAHDPDIADLVVPPHAQAGLIRQVMAPGRVIICQKPFCTSVTEAQQIVTLAETAGATLVIHENFRFQPWYRAIKGFLATGRMGQIYQARFTLRPGDGRGPDAYLARQPSFQDMPRFLIQETAVHLIDVFRYLFGDIDSVYADLRQLNPVIAGEDAGLLILSHGTIRTVFDGNRLSDQVAQDPRRTMGDMVIEGAGGTLRLDGDGAVWFRAFGAMGWEAVPTGPVDLYSFGGGCVHALIDHVIHGPPYENTGRDYLHILDVVEAAYLSHKTGQKCAVSGG